MRIVHRSCDWSALICAGLLIQAKLAAADPGLSQEKLRTLPSQIQQFVTDKTIAGAVTLVARHGQVASLEATGLADIDQNKGMRPDSLFWIASMTKPITATAVLMLQDDGKLSVDDPVEKHLPEFKNQWLIEARSNERDRKSVG